MVVDVVFPGWVPFASLAESQNIPGYIKAHDQILEYDFDFYVGGHLDRSGVRADVVIQKEFVTDLYNNCVEAILLSGSPVVAANPGNSWALFKAYYIDDVASLCATQKWLGRLGAADVFTFSHAVTMVESLRIDYGVLGRR